MAQPAVTFAIEEIDTFPLKVELCIPPTGPKRMQGVITANCRMFNKQELKALAEEGLEDAEYFERIVVSLDGMGRKGADGKAEPVTGEAAIKEALEGKYNTYILPAIIGTYFEQFGEARRKNSKTSSNR